MIKIDEAIELLERSSGECMDTLAEFDAACDLAVVALDLCKWYPAKQLPPEGLDVLCWYEYFRFGDYNCMFRTYGIGYQHNGYWGGEVSQGRNAKVLCWKYLQEPPEWVAKNGVKE